jgi:hypothetical protein
MSKLQHTPGPWKYTISKNSGRHQISDAKCGGQVCAIWSRGKDITEANARLIAAAPEMLNELIKIYTTMYMTQRECYWMPIKDVIEKATGMSIEEVISL